jgi:hypothetical protein
LAAIAGALLSDAKIPLAMTSRPEQPKLIADRMDVSSFWRFFQSKLGEMVGFDQSKG